MQRQLFTRSKKSTRYERTSSVFYLSTFRLFRRRVVALCQSVSIYAPRRVLLCFSRCTWWSPRAVTGATPKRPCARVGAYYIIPPYYGGYWIYLAGCLPARVTLRSNTKKKVTRCSRRRVTTNINTAAAVTPGTRCK